MHASIANIGMNLQGWKMYVWKTQIPVRSDGKRKYGKYKYMFGVCGTDNAVSSRRLN